MKLETLTLALDGPVATVRLNRPDKANAMNLAMWHDIRRAFQWVDETAEARVAILEGEGRHFTAGIDLQMMAGLLPSIHDDCDGRTREKLRRVILDLQDTLTSLERCRKPVLAAIHGACVGGGVDLVCGADMRYAAADAQFIVKEIDLGMVADVGTLQRLPKIVGSQGWVRELAYTGRTVDAHEAREMGLVSRVFESHEALATGVREIAATIAAKSPLAIRGLKEMLNYSRDHSVAEGLNQVATWNAAMLMSEDLMTAMTAASQKKAPTFRD
jgi:enoyl-CoA hydratase